MEQTTERPLARPRRRITLTLGVGESVRIALESLRANKLRTFLTMLGIIIGVWSVVSLLSIGNGAQKYITDQVRSVGTNLLFLTPGANRRGPEQATGTAQNLTVADYEAIKRGVAEIELLSPEFQSGAQVVAGSQNRTAAVVGVLQDYLTVHNYTVATGQFITNDMVDGVRQVAVIGAQLATDLYGGPSAVGQTIRVKGKPLHIIGIMAPSSGFGGVDETVIVPLTTAQHVLFDASTPGSASSRLNSISIQIRSAPEIDLAQAKVEQIMRRRHRLSDDGKSDDFVVRNQATLLTTLNTITTTLTLFLGAIAGISLIVGGIGVMNIMLVSVTERTKEIGLRKAVGAKRSDILRQFLVEALTMSLFGGIIGLLLGMLTAYLVSLTKLITPVVTPAAVIMALSFSAAVGLFFGVYPARRASRLNPIQALRYD
ncbi:MAG: ABC transporter permease [Herpetosiphon sp.]